MIRHSPCSPRSDTLFLDTTLFRVEEAGLVRAGGVGAELHAVLGDDRRRRGLRALAVPGLAVERLLLLHVLVGEGVEAASGELRAQRVADPLAVAEHAGTTELYPPQDGVSVDHQPGQPPAFTLAHPPGVGTRATAEDLRPA